MALDALCLHPDSPPQSKVSLADFINVVASIHQTRQGHRGRDHEFSTPPHSASFSKRFSGEKAKLKKRRKKMPEKRISLNSEFEAREQLTKVMKPDNVRKPIGKAGWDNIVQKAI